MEHIQHLLNRNPTAEVIIAQDGDNAGIRFAINYLGLKHPKQKEGFSITPYITYSTPPISIQSAQLLTGTAGYLDGAAQKEEVNFGDSFLKGQNHLKLEITHLLSEQPFHMLKQQNETYLIDFTHRLNKFATLEGNEFKARAGELCHFQVADKMITHAVISFPNDSNRHIRALNRLSETINQMHTPPLFTLCRPSRAQKDFNEVLQQRKGQKLPESSLLTLTPFQASTLRLNLPREKPQKKLCF
jgi:hypothetical protein